MSSAHFILMEGALIKIILKPPNGFARLLNRETPTLNMLLVYVITREKA